MVVWGLSVLQVRLGKSKLNGGTTITRKEHPWMFWSNVVMTTVIGFIMVWVGIIRALGLPPYPY
jgi:hypothetical protein